METKRNPKTASPMINYLHDEKRTLIKSLKEEAEMLSNKMQYFIERLRKIEDNRIAKPNFNSLGEVQAAGPRIDRMCGELSMICNLINKFS